MVFIYSKFLPYNNPCLLFVKKKTQTNPFDFFLSKQYPKAKGQENPRAPPKGLKKKAAVQTLVKLF